MFTRVAFLLTTLLATALTLVATSTGRLLEHRSECSDKNQTAPEHLERLVGVDVSPC